MRNIVLMITLIIAVSCSSGKVDDKQSLEHFQYIHNVMEKKDFFKARDALNNAVKLTAMHRLILEAGVDNAFNKPASSNNKIVKLFKNYSSQLNDSIKLELLELKQANHGRLFEYAAAAATIENIVSSYSYMLLNEQVHDHKNTLKIWQALKAEPQQQILIKGHTRMKMSRDKANLPNLEVSGAGVSTGFIFDTGANISTVTRTTAQKLGMKMLDATIEVGSITGGKVQSGLAVCPEMKIGNITVKNAVFLVFEDKDLAFPQIDYQINGILGFPVIEAMQEVQITTADEFIVPLKQSSYENQNMALDFLTPVIQIESEHFTFDTGATTTSLYRKYYEKHKVDIEQAYSETELRLGGAGGLKTFTGYKITFTPVVNGKRLKMEDVQLHKESIDEKDDFYYGNIGQDLIKQFSKMTINFNTMFIRFD